MVRFILTAALLASLLVASPALAKGGKGGKGGHGGHGGKSHAKKHASKGKGKAKSHAKGKGKAKAKKKGKGKSRAKAHTKRKGKGKGHAKGRVGAKGHTGAAHKGANYYRTNGVRYAGGYYYSGRKHNHWSQTVYNKEYKTTTYFDPGLKVWYYWDPVTKRYYPLSHKK
jgi:hypothetical protein